MTCASRAPRREEELARIHDREYITLIAETAGSATALDPDTFTSPDRTRSRGSRRARRSTCVEHVLEGSGRARARDGAASRPSRGAEPRDGVLSLQQHRDCRGTRARHAACQRVAIVDYDVHHGNGTQWSFYDDPSVLFISSHQYPYYPGTGAASDIGHGEGHRLHGEPAARRRRDRRGLRARLHDASRCRCCGSSVRS